MSNRFLTAVPLIGLVLLTACAAPKPAQLYSGPERPLSEVAIVKGLSSAEFHSSFPEGANLSKADGAARLNGLVTGDPTELRLLPGPHGVVVRCAGVLASFSGWINLDLAAGMTYEVACGRQPGNVSRFVIVLARQYKTGLPG